MGDGALRTYTIYDHPADYPAGFVMRIWIVDAGGPVPDAAIYANTLAQARLLIPPELVCVHRQDDDDPTIVETWL